MSARTCTRGCSGCEECTEADDVDGNDVDDPVCPDCYGTLIDEDGLLPCPLCQAEQTS